VAGGDFAIRACQQATSTIPIVGLTDDMLAAGLVDSMSRPGGNITGVSLLAPELDGKRQDILIEAVPGLRRMEAFADTETASPLLFGNRKVLLERAAALRLPAIYQWPEVAEEGGFIGYGPRLGQLHREILAPQVVKILRGAKPAEVPVQQPTKFELVINLQT